MKIIVFIRRSRLDAAFLTKRHPEHEFVQVDDDTAAMLRALPGADALITTNSNYDRVVSDAVRANGTKWVQFTTSGIDQALKVGGFAPHTIVSNAPGLSAPVIAEHAFALLLSISRRIAELQAARASKEWRQDFKGKTIALHGKTICIIGLGAAGQQIAKRARAFGMTVIGVSRTPTSTEDVAKVYPREQLLDAIKEADVLLVSTGSDADTAKIVSAKAIAAMKPGAILVNIARGALVDQEALIAACRSGQLAGAGLDVAEVEPPPPDSPLWTLPNIVLTPHLAGSGSDKSGMLYDLLRENIRRYAAGQPLVNQLDWKNMRIA